MIEQFFIEDKFVEIVFISELDTIPNEILRLREKKCFVEFVK
jgi:hypothetical protein